MTLDLFDAPVPPPPLPRPRTMLRTRGPAPHGRGVCRLARHLDQLLRVAARRSGCEPVDLGFLFLASSSGLTLAAGAVSVPLSGVRLTL